MYNIECVLLIVLCDTRIRDIHEFRRHNETALLATLPTRKDVSFCTKDKKNNKAHAEKETTARNENYCKCMCISTFQALLNTEDYAGGCSWNDVNRTCALYYWRSIFCLNAASILCVRTDKAQKNPIIIYYPRLWEYI